MIDYIRVTHTFTCISIKYTIFSTYILNRVKAKYTVNSREVSTPQYKKEILCLLRPSKACFPSYSLLNIKENTQSAHIELPCRLCRKETSGTLLYSITSDGALYHDFLRNFLPELLKGVRP
jgi:hypothetical protein